MAEEIIEIEIVNNSDVVNINVTPNVTEINVSNVIPNFYSQLITIAQIRSLSGNLRNEHFFTTDEGQEGNWYYESTDTTSGDNTGTVLVTADGKRIKRIYENPVFLEWFGVKVGDECSTIFETVINKNKHVKVRSTGEFFLNKAVNLNTPNTDTTIDLGNSTFKILPNSNSNAFLIKANRSGVINGTIDGDYPNQNTLLKQMVGLEGADDAFCKNVTIRNSQGFGIRSKGGGRNIITGNNIKNCLYIPISCSPNFEIPVEGPIVEDNIVDQTELGDLATLGGIKVSQSSGKTGTYYRGGRLVNNISIQPIEEIVYEAFVFRADDGTVSGNYSYGGGVGITVSGFRNSTFDNVFESSLNIGLEISQSKHSSFTFNKLFNCGTGIIQTIDVTAPPDYSLISCNHIVVSNNSIKGSVDRAVSVYEGDNFIFSNNVIEGNKSIDIYDSIGNVEIFGNVVNDLGSDGPGQPFFRLIDSNNVNIYGNYFNGITSTIMISLVSTNTAFIPDYITFKNNYLNLPTTSNAVKIDELASGQIGDNFKVYNNEAVIQNSLSRNYTDYKNNVSVGVRAGTPVGFLDYGIGSTITNNLTGELFVKKGAGTLDWGEIALIRDLDKPVLTLPQTTYGFIKRDRDNFINGVSTSATTYTIPTSVFITGDQLQGVFNGSTGTIVAASGITLNFPETNVISKFGRFNIKFISATVANLTSDYRLAEFANDSAAATGGVEVGKGYVNSSSGSVQRRLT
jgi:hypothetical protein